MGVRAGGPAGTAGGDAHRRRRRDPALRHHRACWPRRCAGTGSRAAASPATPGRSGTTTPTGGTRSSTWPATSGSGWSATRTPARVALPVERALERGVAVALGQDDIEDAYYPFGRHNLLEVAFLAAHLLDMRSAPQLEVLVDLVTTSAARVLGLRRLRAAGGRPGRPARARRRRGRSTCWPTTPRRASSSAPARCLAPSGRGQVLASLALPQSWKTSMARPSRPGARRGARSRGR